MTGILFPAVLMIQSVGFTAQEQTGLHVVRAVLFYSPACGHCQMVIQESIPPLFERYGSQLEIIGVDVTQPQGQILFEAAYRMFNLDSAGVPLLVIGNEYLVGSLDIPQNYPVSSNSTSLREASTGRTYRVYAKPSKPPRQPRLPHRQTSRLKNHPPPPPLQTRPIPLAFNRTNHLKIPSFFRLRSS